MNDAARERFDYAVDLRDLPVSESIRRALDLLCTQYDTSLDWDDPGGESPWSADQARDFEATARSMLLRLQLALGPDFIVLDEIRA